MSIMRAYNKIVFGCPDPQIVGIRVICCGRCS